MRQKSDKLKKDFVSASAQLEIFEGRGLIHKKGHTKIFLKRNSFG